jgi:hypothetical protein
MKTFSEVMNPAGVEIPAHLIADAEIPVLSGVQRQGDLIVVPTRKAKDHGQTIPAAGVAVVRGEATGNTHLLVGDGSWRPVESRGGQDLGVMTILDGGTAYLLHREHGAQGFAPGAYLIRRQREQADEIRLVAD